METVAASIVVDVVGHLLRAEAKNVAKQLADLVKNEAQYLCCFNGYAENFDQRREILAKRLQDVNTEIEKASGSWRVRNEARQWARDATDLIDVDTKQKVKCFNGLCLNCLWQYKRGKKLAVKTKQIDELLERSNFMVSRTTFIHFESRKLTFKVLMEALEDEYCNVIGLHGFGGIGKTSMAKEVGAKLEESEFGKVIFLVVSNPPNFKELRGEIARHLDLQLEYGEEENDWEKILSRIIGMQEKLLIILDDVWEKFDLSNNLGIPSYRHHKGCSVLITTRDSQICAAMGCQRVIHLNTLTDEESLDLFLAHANINNSNDVLMRLALEIVKRCGGVPVAIVAVAKTLKGRPTSVWENALRTMENHHGDQHLAGLYEQLKLSYDNLKNEMAKELFLISSLFPEDYEIPIGFLRKIGIGLDYGYYSSRSQQVFEAIQELIDSSLLLKAKEECVKMHDLVRDVALSIGSKHIQSIIGSNMSIKEDLRYLLWKNDDFLNEFHGKNLEILLTFLNGSNDLKVPDSFFVEMTRLKVVFLMSTSRISAPSLSPSLQSLKDIQTLTLANLKLDDISTLGNLLCLEILWLCDCSIIEIPREFLELKNLRSLEVEGCEIEMNNPFEVIEGCSQLEELIFVHNDYDIKVKNHAISENVPSLKIDRYQITATDLPEYFKKYGSMERCFSPNDLRHLISEATLKQLVGKSELLMLGGYEETRWENLVPDIVSIDEGGMNNLIILHLYCWPGIQCLVDIKDPVVDMTAFSTLVELSLYKMDVQNLYQGSLPSSFLEQLEIMKLEDCPVLTSIFQPRALQSMKKLKELAIKYCNALECIITDMSSEEEIVGDVGDNDQKSYDSLFPKLRTLQIAGCDKLKIILRVIFVGRLQSLEEIKICGCKQLVYIFDKFQEEDHAMLPSLKQMELSGVPSLISIFREYHKPRPSLMQRPSLPSRGNSKEKHTSPGTLSLFWANVCGFLNKSRAMSEETKVAVSKERLLKHRIPQVHMNSCFIFPRLEKLEIIHCKALEFLFPSTISVGLQSLRTLTVKDAPKLRDVFGKYDTVHHLTNQNQNDNLHIDLPALAVLGYRNMPKFISSAINYYLASPSLQEVLFYECGIKSFTDMIVFSGEGQLNGKTTKDLDASRVPPFHAAQSLSIQSLNNIKEIKLVKCWNLISLSTLTIASTILWENLTIGECHQLKCIVADKGDPGAPMNLNSIFPMLRKLEVSECDELEYLFPTSAFTSPIYFESLIIHDAQELKYVFGRSHHEDYLSHENQNIRTYIDFPALKMLKLKDVPNLVSIFPHNYFLRSPTQNSIHLELSPVIDITSDMDFMVFAHATQQDSTTTKVAEEEIVENVEEDDISGKPKMTISSSDSKYIGQLKVPIPTSSNITVIPTEDNTSTAARLFEIEEEEEGRNIQSGVENTNQQTQETTDHTIQVSSQSRDLAIFPSRSGVGDEDIKEVGNTTPHGDQANLSGEVRVDPSKLTQMEQESLYSRGFTSDLIITTGRYQGDIEEKPKTSFIHGLPYPVEGDFTTKSIINLTKDSSLCHSDSSHDVDDVRVSDDSQALDIVSNGSRKPIPHPTTSFMGADKEDIKEANVVQNESMANVESHGEHSNSSGDVRVDPSKLKQTEQESSYSRGQIVKHHDVKKSDTVEDAQSSTTPLSPSFETAPSFDESNEVLIARGVQEIVDMMKLDGHQASLLAEAFKTHPQLRLSTNDQSTQMLLMFYRVLVDILNITGTPFTITEADKRLLLEERLKDADLLGFDKDWIESIKTKVFNCDHIPEADRIQ